MCHSSLEFFWSPEVVHFIHKRSLRAFPMQLKDSDWAITSLFWRHIKWAAPFKPNPLAVIVQNRSAQFPIDAFAMQLVLPGADRGSFSICTVSMGQVCLWVGDPELLEEPVCACKLPLYWVLTGPGVAQSRSKKHERQGVLEKWCLLFCCLWWLLRHSDFQ